MNKLARSITKLTKACDKRQCRLISYIHHRCEYKQYCYVGNTAKQCRLGLFQDSDFAGDAKDSKSTSGGTLCVFESHSFAPVSWMCKKQTSVSHSSTEAEVISIDAGLRMDGIPALDLWIFGIWNLVRIVSRRSSMISTSSSHTWEHCMVHFPTRLQLLGQKHLRVFQTTISPKIITFLTRYRCIVLELILNCNACNFTWRRFFGINFKL